MAELEVDHAPHESQETGPHHIVDITILILTSVHTSAGIPWMTLDLA